MKKIILILLVLSINLISLAQISGFVFRDYNGNGIKDNSSTLNEVFVEGITVNAYNSTNQLVGTTLTDLSGAYSFNGLILPIRIEFTGIQSGDFSSFANIGNGTSIQFYTSANINANYAINTPDDYNTIDPALASTLFVNGDPLAGGNAGAVGVLKMFNNSSTGNGTSTGANPATDLVTASQVGSVYGIAWDKKNKKMLLSAFAKRHCGFGPLGEGGIYQIDLSSGSPVVSNWLDIKTLGIPVNDIGTGSTIIDRNINRGLLADKVSKSMDPDAFDAVGKTSIGAIEFSKNADTLFIVNLTNRTVYAIDVATKTLVGTYNPPAAVCPSGTFRTFALKYYNGKLYMVGVCDGSTSSDMSSIVYRLDGNSWTQVFSMPMNYTKGYSWSAAAAGTACENSKGWYPWTATPIAPCFGNVNLGSFTYPTPIFSDIEFDEDGSMILAFMDRTSHQIGWSNASPTSLGDTWSSVVGGDILRVYNNNGVFVLENNGTSGGNTSAGANNSSGPGGGEFYYQDNLSTQHTETSSGGLTRIKGGTEVTLTAMDPFATGFETGGINWFNNTTGAARNTGFYLYSGGAGFFGKSGGMGDVEYVTDLAPIEIGNRVWNDVNGNGIQDAGETGIAGVIIELYQGVTLVGTTTTDANGDYYFNNSNVNQNGAIKVEANTTYEIRINVAQGSLSSTPILTSANTDGSPNGDARDSDGTGGGAVSTISLTTGNSGENNHTYDFGFKSTASLCVWDPLNGPSSVLTINGTTPPANPVYGLVTDPSVNPGGEVDIYVERTVTGGTASGAYNDFPTGTYTISFSNGVYGYTSLVYDGPDGNANVLNPTGLGGLDMSGNSDGFQFSYNIDGNALTPQIVIATIKVYTDASNYSTQQITINTPTGPSAYLTLNFPRVGFTPSAGVGVNWSNVGAIELFLDCTTTDGVDLALKDLKMPCYELPKACLGNYVFSDLNQDGIQNNGEVGVSGVTTTLYNATTNVILATVTTDAYGFYQFCGLNPGDYKVGFSLPTNYVFSDANTGGNDDLDSDPNPISGLTGTYTLASGDSIMTVDAGIYQPQPSTAKVGDKVWFDTDGDGIQEPGESGVSGITVSLYSCGNLGTPIMTTITNATGNYLFENVTPGSYAVGFTVPIGMVFTIQSGGVSEVANSDINPLTERTACFTVNAGDQITYVDAGITPKPISTVSIGDKVWNDVNQDGIQDPTETGVQGVEVTLYAQDGITVIATTSTDALGNYSFTSQAAGCYVIGFSLPLGYTRTTQNAGSDSTKNSDASASTGLTNVICISAGQNNPTIDAGIYNVSNTNSVGDKVWYDQDQDGIQDPSEYGYPGVVVTLYNCTTNTIIATTTTDANGNYLFDGIANGDYYVGFGFIPGYQFTGANSDAAGILGANNSDANPSNGLTSCVSLIGNTQITTIDAGIYPGNNRSATSSLGDIVWTDANNNGLQDNGETGVSGVSVTLYEEDGLTVIATTITDGLGNYIFTNLDGGNYVVGFSNLPVGYTFTTPSGILEDENNSDANVLTGKTGVITLGVGEDKMSVDAGIVAPVNTVCLGDYVWIDLDNDGTQDANEPAVPGVTVKLYDNNTNTVLQVTTTNSEGNYLFCGLTNGSTYSVGFENIPAGFVFTSQTGALNVPDNSDANPATGRTSTVTLGASNDLTLDAGIYSATTAVVGNYVWYDEDADGIQDPTEAPIPGVLVTLYDNTNTQVASAVTDANGGYLFTNVTPGTYTIGFEGYPSTLVPTTKGGNANADDDSNVDPITGRTDAFTVTAGSSNLTLDAGYKANPIAGLGNYVWHDVNENGLQDASEPAISGVIVTLYGADGITVRATAITDGNGAYSFPNLTAGNYVVGFAAPVGFTRTQVVGVINDVLNSDINASNKTNVITLVAGSYNPNIDAGYYIGFPLPAKELTATLAIIKANNACEVNWYTKDESNTKTFDIERSIDGTTFTKLGETDANVKTEGRTNYVYNDNIESVKAANIIYYRIKLNDIDGKYSFSNTISVRPLSFTSESVTIYPSPFTDRISIGYLATENSDIQIEITDASGRVILKQINEVVEGQNTINLTSLDKLSSGMYTVKIRDINNGETFIRNVVK